MIEAKRPRGRPRKSPPLIPSGPLSIVPAAPSDRPGWMPVTVHFPRRAAAFGDADTKSSVEVGWPKDWPLPAMGSRITVHERSGFVEYVTFDPVNGRVSISTR